MQPDSKPESERKPKHIEQAAEAMEAGKVESLAGAQFEHDAAEWNKLQDKAVDLALQKDKLKETGGLMNVRGGERGIESDEQAVQDKLDKLVEKYGEGKEDFIADAEEMRSLDQQTQKAEAKLKELESAQSFDYKGGARLLESDKQTARDRIAELQKKKADIKDRRSKPAEVWEDVDLSDLEADEGPEIEIGEAEIDLADLGENPLEDLKDEEIEAALSKMESGELERTAVDKSGKELSEVEVSLLELQEIEKQRVRDEQTEARQKEENAKELQASLAELKEMEKERVQAEIETAKQKAENEKELQESLAELRQIEKERVFEEDIASAASAEELKAAVEKMGTVRRSDGKTQDAATINRRIDAAMEHPVLLGQLTRKHGLRDKVRELGRAARGEEEPVLLTPEMKKKQTEGEAFTAEEQAFFDKGEAQSKDNQEMLETIAEGGIIVTDDMLEDMRFDGITDGEIDAAFEQAESGSLERRKVESLIEKNEVTPEQKQALENDLKRIENELFDAKKGIELDLVDPVSGKEYTEYRPGIEELAKDLKDKYGVDVDAMGKALEGAKSDDEVKAILKKENSVGSKLKRGMKFLLSPGYRRTMDKYQQRLDEINDLEDQKAQTELMLKDPKAAADLANRRMMRAMLTRAKQQARSSTRPPGSPFGLRF